MGVIAWLLVSLVVYLEYSNRQSSVIFAPLAIVAPGMCEDPVIFKHLSQTCLCRATYKVTSYIDFAPYVQSLRMFVAYLVHFTNDLNSPNIMNHFREAGTTGLSWERSKI